MNDPVESQGAPPDGSDASSPGPGSADPVAEPVPPTPLPNDGPLVEVVLADAPQAGPPPLPGSTQAVETTPPGPGLPEAVCWTLGVLGVHLAAAIVILMLIAMTAVFAAVSHPAPDGTPDLRSLPSFEDLKGGGNLILLGGEEGLFVIAAAAAMWLRLRPGTARHVPLRSIPLGHLVLLVSLVLPVSLLCGELYRSLDVLWQVFLETLPIPKEFLNQLNTVEQLQHLVTADSLPVMLFIIAVGPALGEEMIFRGVIGRGLVARWGIVAGVLMTSCLFGAVHLHPVHALGVVPLGIVMHLLYLATRSFWAPMLYHFLNNAWATAAIALRQEVKPELLTEDVPLDRSLLITSLFLTVAAVALLWQSRVEYRLPDGATWDPGYPTADAPPQQWNARRECRPASKILLVAVVAGLVAFVAALITVGQS